MPKNEDATSLWEGHYENLRDSETVTPHGTQ